MNVDDILNKLKSLSKEDLSAQLKSIDRGTWMRFLVGFFFFSVLAIFFIYPAWISRLTIRHRITEMEIQVNTAKLLVSQEKQIQENREALLKRNDAIRNQLYNPGESSQLLGAISRLAQDSKAVIVASDPRPVEPFPAPWDQKYAPVAYGLSLEGNYHSLASFIAKVENSSQILRVQTYSIKPQEKNSDKHSAELILLGFVKK